MTALTFTVVYPTHSTEPGRCSCSGECPNSSTRRVRCVCGEHDVALAAARLAPPTRCLFPRPGTMTDAEAEEAGRAAFAAGQPRLVPRDLLVGSAPAVGEGDGIANARAWYRGWDAANLATDEDPV